MMLVSRLQDQGFDYQGDYEIYEFVHREEDVTEEAELAKILEKVDNPYGWKKKREAENQPQQVVKEIPRKIIKTLNKKHIDEFVEKYLRFHPEVESKVIQLLVKELRIVNPIAWITHFLPELLDSPTTRNEKSASLADLVGNKNLKVVYNQYQTALEMIDEDIDSWFSSLVEMQDSKSRTQRNRCLGDFLK
jgi:inactivated superfamily I helicase